MTSNEFSITNFEIPTKASVSHLIDLIGIDEFKEELIKRQKAKADAILQVTTITSIQREKPATENEVTVLSQVFDLYQSDKISDQVWYQIQALFVYHGAQKDAKNCLELESFSFPEAWTPEQDLAFAKRLLPRFLHYKLHDYRDFVKGINKLLKNHLEEQTQVKQIGLQGNSNFHKEQTQTFQNNAESLTPERFSKEQELANWDLIKNSQNPKDFSDHISRFPGGACERQAVAKLEQYLWISIENNPNYNDLKEFTKQFPRSGYAALALQKIIDFEKQEGEHWTAIKGAERIEAVEHFLQLWPDGPHHKQAQKKIQSLRKAPLRRTVLKGMAAAGVIGLIGGYKFWPQSLNDSSLHTLRGHLNTVKSVAFSPDGQMIISGSADKTLVLWKTATGEQIRSFQGHTADVESVSFSPHGRYIVSGSRDATIRLWDVQTGKELHKFENDNKWVTSVAFSPDSKTVLSAGDDKLLRLWQVETKEQIRVFTGHSDYILSAAFSPTGKTILSGGHDKTVILWDVSTGDILRTFKGHTDWVTSVAYSPNGSTILSGSFDKTVKLWDITSGQELATYKGYEPTNMTTVAFCPNGQKVIGGGYDNKILIWDLKSKQQINKLKGHTSSSIHTLGISPNGEFLISGSADNTLKIWKMAKL